MGFIAGDITVWVATYEHKHGTDIRVFPSEADCILWHDAIALENWESEFDEPLPTDKTDSEIGNLYFEKMEEEERAEFVSWEPHEVKPFK